MLPRLLQLAYPWKNRLPSSFPGGCDVVTSKLSGSVQRMKGGWHVWQLSSRRVTSDDMHHQHIQIQSVPVPGSEQRLQPSDIQLEEGSVRAFFLDLSTATLSRRDQSRTASLESHCRYPPPYLGRNGHGMPAFAVRYHMGGVDHHHSPRMHELKPNDKSALEAGEKISKIGLLADVLLTVGKGAAGWISGSTAIIADAAHSVSDIALSAVTLWSVRDVQRARGFVVHPPFSKVLVIAVALDGRFLVCARENLLLVALGSISILEGIVQLLCAVLVVLSKWVLQMVACGRDVRWFPTIKGQSHGDGLVSPNTDNVLDRTVPPPLSGCSTLSNGHFGTVTAEVGKLQPPEG